jgi:hypothetical protein
MGEMFASIVRRAIAGARRVTRGPGGLRVIGAFLDGPFSGALDSPSMWLLSAVMVMSCRSGR